jgi:hypothetical protein
MLAVANQLQRTEGLGRSELGLRGRAREWFGVAIDIKGLDRDYVALDGERPKQ